MVDVPCTIIISNYRPIAFRNALAAHRNRPRYAFHLSGVLTESEIASEMEPVYEKFLKGELRPEGKDLCDMSGATDRTPDEYTVFNAMLPRKYHPAWQVLTVNLP